MYDDGVGIVPAPFWYHRDFIPVACKAVKEASGKIRNLGFCQQRIWNVAKISRNTGELEMIPLVSALQNLPNLRHDGHESCTPAFCEFATLNFTSVTQLHKCPDPKSCVTTTDKMFNQSLLAAALESEMMTTAWTLDGMYPAAPLSCYFAVSHVWSDGTGAGAWQAGKVNKCLWDFFSEKAQSLGCDGVWWDTVCIPQDKAARSIALNRMHRNYSAAECTLVHDLYLAGTEWKKDGSPCIALVLSPWFTRGWTALELLLSKRVFIIFREGGRYTLKNLDELLAGHRFLDSRAHWIATHAVECLRTYGQRNFGEGASRVLSILQGRYTSWSRDQSIIAGLMCGLTDHAGLSEQDITKRIILRIGKIRQNCLLHSLPTMSEPQLSWCPPRFVDIPAASEDSLLLSINADGTLYGLWEIWYIPSKIYVDRGMIWPLSTDSCMQTQVRWALQEPEKCVILTFDTFDSQGLLVRLKAYNDRPQEDILYCKYIGGVGVSPSEIRKPRFHIRRRVVIGYLPGMVDVRVVDLGAEQQSLQR